MKREAAGNGVLVARAVIQVKGEGSRSPKGLEGRRANPVNGMDMGISQLSGVCWSAPGAPIGERISRRRGRDADSDSRG